MEEISSVKVKVEAQEMGIKKEKLLKGRSKVGPDRQEKKNSGTSSMLRKGGGSNKREKRRGGLLKTLPRKMKRGGRCRREVYPKGLLSRNSG